MRINTKRDKINKRKDTMILCFIKLPNNIIFLSFKRKIPINIINKYYPLMLNSGGIKWSIP